VDAADHHGPGVWSAALHTLHEQVAGVSQRMLSQTLHALTRDGLVTRTAYPEVPPRVEYALTPLGRSLDEAVSGLVHWVRDHQDDIVRNRDEFDQTPAANAATRPAHSRPVTRDCRKAILSRLQTRCVTDLSRDVGDTSG
jgi:DNA-binding HxlR family transcriptional regulator